MKRFSSLLFILLAAVLCVAAAKAPVKSLLLDDKGNWLIVKNQVVQATKALSKEDATRLAKAAQGFTETDVVNTTVHTSAVNQTVMKHKTDLKATPAGREIMSILAKYQPQETAVGFLVVNNQVVQASRPLSSEDVKKLRAISAENKQASTLVNKVVYEDFIDESLYSTGVKNGGPELRAEYARVMSKYER